jgi:hypothetical protein
MAGHFLSPSSSFDPVTANGEAPHNCGLLHRISYLKKIAIGRSRVARHTDLLSSFD